MIYAKFLRAPVMPLYVALRSVPSTIQPVRIYFNYLSLT